MVGILRSEALFSYLSGEERVPLDYPLWPIQKIVYEALGALTGEFEKLYAKLGWLSIPPEKLLRALLLQAFYSVRSERQLMEQLGYNLLFRWFVGLSLDAVVWDDGVHQEPRAADRRRHRQQVHGGGTEPGAGQGLLSDDHFSVDGTLIEAWASMKSFRPEDGRASRRRRAAMGISDPGVGLVAALLAMEVPFRILHKRRPSLRRNTTWLVLARSLLGIYILEFLCRDRCRRLSGCDALAGDVEIARLDFDADVLVATLNAGDARRAAAHEGVTYECVRRRNAYDFR